MTSNETSTPATDSVVADGATDTAALAARRRSGRKSGNRSMPAAAAQAEPGTAAPAPAADAPATPVTVIVDRTVVQGVEGTNRGPIVPVGGVWLGPPLVSEIAPAGAGGQVVPGGVDYVIADCNADEVLVPPGCITPVAKKLWTVGQRVRRDLYDAVMAAQPGDTPVVVTPPGGPVADPAAAPDPVADAPVTGPAPAAPGTV